MQEKCAASLTVIHSWSWTERVSFARAIRRGNTEVAAIRVASASSGVIEEISSALGNRLFCIMMITQVAEGQARLSSNNSAAKSSRSAFSRIVGGSIVRGRHWLRSRWKTNATSRTRDLEISTERGIFPVYRHPPNSFSRCRPAHPLLATHVANYTTTCCVKEFRATLNVENT